MQIFLLMSMMIKTHQMLLLNNKLFIYANFFKSDESDKNAKFKKE